MSQIDLALSFHQLLGDLPQLFARPFWPLFLRGLALLILIQIDQPLINTTLFLLLFVLIVLAALLQSLAIQVLHKPFALKPASL